MLVKQHLCIKPNTIPFGLRILSKSLALLKLQVPYFKNWGSKWPYLCHKVFGALCDTIYMKMS